MTYIILVKEHVKLSDTNSQICLIEFIWNIPSKRTELPPLLYDTVEEAETKEHFSEGTLKVKKVQQSTFTCSFGNTNRNCSS